METDEKLRVVANNNYFIIKSYVGYVVKNTFWGGGRIDPFEADKIRASHHDTIAQAFALPRGVVTLCCESIEGANGKNADLYTFYKDTNDMNETINRFIERIIKAWHEFHEQGLYRDMVEWIADSIWIEKAASEINALPNISSLAP